MMGIRVQEANDDDMYRLFVITSLAFQHNEPFWDMTYPNHDTDQGREAGHRRFIEDRKTDPTCVYVKAVDAATGIIIGMARWFVGNRSMPLPEFQVDDPGYEEENSREDYKSLFNSFMKERNAAIAQTKGQIVSLDALAVDPAFQRKGAGDALVKWGVAKADEMEVEAVVESSVYGRMLYEKNGFVWQKDVVVDAPERWKDMPKQMFSWMVRPASRQGQQTLGL